MIATLLTILKTLGAFVVVTSIIVFIHEFGHYIIAKMCGVRITTFSIGFGKEILGWNDKSGTRWKVGVLPLGGYVKMFGDASAASNADTGALEAMTDAERKVAFHYKPLHQKAMVVSAGPIFNFILTIVIFTYIIFTNGLQSTEPVIGKIIENSAASEAGLQVGDRVTFVDDHQIKAFNDIPFYVSTNLGEPVVLSLVRGEEKLKITLTPRMTESDDGLGNKIKRPMIGIGSPKITFEEVGFFGSIYEATKRTYLTCENTLRVIGQLITGKRDAKEMRGTIGIAQISGQAAEKGLDTLIWIIAVISANLGLMNLLPIPVLDGGHLVFYTIEALFRRPLAEKVQEWSMRIGFSIVCMLMAYTLMNDIRRLAGVD